MSFTYSIIIPAYNEETLLPATLQALKHAMSGIEAPGEIIVVDNNSNDATAAIATEHGTQVVFEPINQISRARNTGARTASGKYLVFLDADTTVSSTLLNQALANLESGDCCGGGVVVNGRGPLPVAVQRTLNFWNQMSVKFQWAAGCFIYCLREAFDDVGGFSERVYASEEIWLSRRLGAWGRKYGFTFKIITDPPVLTSMRKIYWYSGRQTLCLLLPILVFPPAVFFRKLCSSWYRRPEVKPDIEGV